MTRYLRIDLLAQLFMNRLLFPYETRSFFGKRWLKVSLRTLHLLGTAGVGGGVLYNLSQQFWFPYLWLVIFSGLAIIAVEIWSNGIWLIQIRGLVIVIKILLISILLFEESFAMIVLIIIIGLSGIISHAPGNVRYFSIFHWKRVDYLNPPQAK